MNTQRRGFAPILILLVVVGIIGVIFLAEKGKLSSVITIGTPVPSVASEDLLLGTCDKNCEVIDTNRNGTSKKYTTKNLAKVFNLSISSDSRYFSLIDNKNSLHLINSESKDEVAFLHAASSSPSLPVMYKDGFWLSDNGTYKYFNYKGETLKTIPISIFPKHFKDYSDASFSVNFGPVYQTNELLAQAISYGGGGGVSTGWDVDKNLGLKKVADLYDCCNTLQKSDNLPWTASVIFLNKEPGFLVASSDGIYILHTDGSREMLVNQKFDTTRTQIVNLKMSDISQKIYYQVQAIGDEPVTPDSNSSLGIYEYNMVTKENKMILSSSAPDIKTPYKFTENELVSISPSGKYAAISVSKIGYGSTQETPGILSLQDYSLKTFDSLTGGNDTQVYFYGWVNQTNLTNIIDSI